MISIIVPIYNVEPYLSRCIQSIVNQTYQDIEIILIDDGSTDNSLQICNSFQKTNSRIKVISQENQGPVAARKTGLQIATGQYIGFVDSDDYIEPDMYESLLRLIEEKKVDFVHSGYYKNESQCNVNPNPELVLCETKQEKELILKERVFTQTNDNSFMPSMWSKLFKRELIINACMQIDNQNNYGEDLLCLCHCIASCKSFYMENSCYYHYMIRETSICNQKGVSTLLREVRLYEALRKVVSDYFSGGDLAKYVECYMLKGMALQLGHLSLQNVPLYSIDKVEPFLDKKLVLYGAGKVGVDYYQQLSMYERCHIVAWVDKNYEKYSFDYYPVRGVAELKYVAFDYVLIAVLNEGLSKCIKEELIQQGIEENSIIWIKPRNNFEI